MLPIAYAILQQLKETDKDISNQISKYNGRCYIIY